MTISFNHSRCNGFSLIEVLVALFVISIGMLGIAGMELFSKSTGNEAIQRSTAVLLAQEMMGKMRANPMGLSAYIGNTVGNASVATPTTNCKTTSCTTAALASYDLWSWEQLLDGTTETSGAANTGGLVQPQACISGPAAGAAGVYTVAIAWRGNTAMGNPSISTCGQSSGLYGTNNEFRRVIIINFYISNDSFT